MRFCEVAFIFSLNKSFPVSKNEQNCLCTTKAFNSAPFLLIFTFHFSGRQNSYSGQLKPKFMEAECISVLADFILNTIQAQIFQHLFVSFVSIPCTMAAGDGY